MKLTHDKVSGALYLELRKGEYDHSEDYSEKADVYLDVDTEGNVLGLEALSFEDLAIEEHGGALGLPQRIVFLEDTGEGFEVEISESGEEASSELRRRS